jgi:hypothetical protein
MPKLKDYNKKPQKKKVVVKELTCVMCGKTQKPTMHYQSYNPLHATGYLPYCKQCLKDMCFNDKKQIDLEKVKQMLKLIDRPFLYDIFKTSVSDTTSDDVIGVYIKNIAMQQYKSLGWADSRFEPEHENENEEKTFDVNSLNSTDLKKLQEKYGYGFDEEEYLNFERKYKKLSRGYKEKTELHTERLITYIIHKVKEEMATAKGLIQDAEK